MVDSVKKPPNAGKGRRKGSPNKTTGALKEAILLAAEDVGEDAKGKGGLQGYLRKLAAVDTRSFASLLGKVLPIQAAMDVTHAYRDMSDEELDREIQRARKAAGES